MASSGGARSWSGALAFNSTANYACGPHAALVDAEGNSDGVTLVSTCQWDKTWTELEEGMRCQSNFILSFSEDNFVC